MGMPSLGIAPMALAALLLTGCPEPTRAPTSDEPAACRRIGDRCTTPEGPIGVCNDTGRSDCEAPPCLQCMPQH